MKRSRESESGSDSKRARSDSTTINVHNQPGAEARPAEKPDESTSTAETAGRTQASAPADSTKKPKDSREEAEGDVDKTEIDSTKEEKETAAKQETPAKQETSKQETAAKQETSAEQETSKQDEPTAESSKESTKEESSKEEKAEPASEKVESSNSEKPSESKPAENSKPMGFSSFGAGFSAFKGFGGGSKFNALSSASKANPWAEPKNATNKDTDTKKKDESTDASSSADSTGDAAPASAAAAETGSKPDTKPENDTYAQITLAKQDVVTGEEDEETVYQTRVRLYAINLSAEEEKSWKERGTGLLKLNRSAANEKYRLVMRADGVLRVSLNTLVTSSINVTKGFPTSLHTEKFLKFSAIEEGKAHQFAVKCSSEAERDELFDAITGTFQK